MKRTGFDGYSCANAGEAKQSVTTRPTMTVVARGIGLPPRPGDYWPRERRATGLAKIARARHRRRARDVENARLPERLGDAERRRHRNMGPGLPQQDGPDHRSR